MNLLPARACIMSAFGAAMLLSIPPACAQSWVVDASGLWDDPENWSAEPPDAIGALVEFSALDIGASRTVTLTEDRIVGHLRFGDLEGASNWTLTTNAPSSAALTLSTSTGIPSIEVLNNTATFRVALKGEQGIEKRGVGTLTLQGTTNTFSGLTRVAEGTLSLGKGPGVISIPGNLVIENSGTVLISGGSNQIADASVVTVNQGGVLNLNNRPEIVASVVLNGGVITNNTGSPTLVALDGFDVRSGAVYSVLGGAEKALTKKGEGTVILAANNTYSGGTLIEQGTLQIGGGGTTGTLGATGSTVTNNGTLAFDRGAGSTLTVSSPISGTGIVLKRGPGTIAFTGANSYSGGTVIEAGTLNLNSTSIPGNGQVTVAGGTLNITANRSVTTAALNNSIHVAGDGAITTTSSSATVDLNLTGAFSGSVGTLTFRNDGANDPTDTFEPRLSGGDFEVSAAINIDNGLVGSTRLNSFNTAGTTQVFNGPIIGNGSFRKAVSSGEGGTTLFNATNSYSGQTLVSAGELIVNGQLGTNLLTVGSGGALGGRGLIHGPVLVQSGGKLVASSMTISNTLTLADNSKTILHLDTAKPSLPVLDGLTHVVLAGNLELNIAGPINGGERFQLFRAGELSGSFASITPEIPGPGMTWNLDRLAIDGTVFVESTNKVAEPVLSNCARMPDRSVRFTINGTVGQTYRVWATTNLAVPTAWNVITNSQFESSSCVVTDPAAATLPQRFYKVTIP